MADDEPASAGEQPNPSDEGGDSNRRAGQEAEDQPRTNDPDVDESSADEAAAATDGGPVETHTIRLELVDEPGELLAALEPIADNGGNLLSIFHERGNLTPRGHIPVEVDLECPPDRFDAIVAALRDAGVTVIQAGRERYGEALTVVLHGHIIDTDLSDTIQRISECADASVEDVALSAPDGADQPSSARLRLGTRAGQREAVLEVVRDIADEKGLGVVEPLSEVSA